MYRTNHILRSISAPTVFVMGGISSSLEPLRRRRTNRREFDERLAIEFAAADRIRHRRSELQN